MRRGECAFELTEQPCVSCGKPSGQQGTCEDLIYCPGCRERFIANNDDGAALSLIYMAEHPIGEEQ